MAVLAARLPAKKGYYIEKGFLLYSTPCCEVRCFPLDVILKTKRIVSLLACNAMRSASSGEFKQCEGGKRFVVSGPRDITRGHGFSSMTTYTHIHIQPASAIHSSSAVPFAVASTIAEVAVAEAARVAL